MNKQQGFTLIEVIVAVGVIAVALPALMYTMSGQIEGLAYLRDKMQADWVAQNAMAQMRINNRIGQTLPENDSGSAEIAGRKWRWTARTKAFPQKELAGVSGIEIQVFLEEKGVSEKDAQALSTLAGVVYARPLQPITTPAPEKYSSGGSDTSDQDSGSSS